jgi:hypothetical protein
MLTFRVEDPMKMCVTNQLEILRPTFKNFTLSATGFGNFLKTVLIFPMNVGSKKDR